MNGFPPGFPGGGGPFGPPPYGATPPVAQNVPPNPNAAANGQPQAHYCFSGSLSCSGCNPCDACAKTIREMVLVPALLEEQAVLGQDLQLAFQQGRPVDLQLLADTFFRTCAAAWKQLHMTMQGMPAGPQRPFRVINVSKVLEAAEIGRQVLAERERAAVAAAPQASVPSSVAMPNIPPQNMAQPVAAPQQTVAAPSHVVPPIMPNKPVDMDRAMRAGGEPSVITVHAEEPAPANGSPGTRPVTADDFAQAAPRAANGADKTPS